MCDVQETYQDVDIKENSKISKMAAMEILQQKADECNSDDFNPIDYLGDKTKELYFIALAKDADNDEINTKYVVDAHPAVILLDIVYFEDEESANQALNELNPSLLDIIFQDLILPTIVKSGKRYQKLDYDVVRDIALGLLDVNPYITTLDVKNAARNEGYWATQDEISKYMKQVAKKEDLDFNAEITGNNKHLVYSKLID